MITAIAVVLLLAAGAWDIYVLLWLERGKTFADRLGSGLTASYNLYLAAQAWPAIAWLFGALSVYVFLHAPSVVAAWWLWINGHIFGTMRGVK